MSVEHWMTRLEQSGCRLTPARRAVVRAVAASPRAVTPLEVFDAARKQHRILGLVSVYRTLEKLEQLGLITRVHQPAGCHAFVAASRGHQHLLLCSRCGRTTYFDGDDLQLLIRAVSRRTGYSIEDHWLQLFGLCRDCRSATKPASSNGE
jgi:Fe2+ or Zn2+ uptake regulation protein